VVVLRGAISRGLTLGIGAPVGRAVFMVTVEPPTVRDADGDGIVDKADACPNEPEDLDGFEDANGCPDLDNDGDGLLDTEDACPDIAEDLDNYRDEDGCIDPETPVVVWITDPKTVPAPAVGVISGQGMAGEIGNYTQLDLNPGSYSILADAPGFESLDATIEVPEQTDPHEVALVMEPVQRLGTVSIQVTDPEGNPVEATWQFTDQPQRRVSTEGSEVSQLPGTYSVLVRSPGYASVNLDVRVRVNRDTALAVVLQPSKVTLTVEKIDIKESVYFDTGRATIKRESFPLLDEVAILIIDHPELMRIRIEGHTDSRGSASSNQRLSEARAGSVLEYLADLGVERERLESIGYGEERPLDPREEPEAWEKNRRVDFFVAARDDDGDGKADEPAPEEAAPDAPAPESPNPWSPNP
jgi:outer membrane protein OmpA-like peptidoglycan-associated protein